MKIQDSEVEFIHTRANEADVVEGNDTCVYNYWIIQFIKTPRGRRKILGEIQEEFYPTSKKLDNMSFSFDGTKTNRERRKILGYLLEKMSFNSITTWVLQLPLVSNGGTSDFYMRFGENK